MGRLLSRFNELNGVLPRRNTVNFRAATLTAALTANTLMQRFSSILLFFSPLLHPSLFFLIFLSFLSLLLVSFARWCSRSLQQAKDLYERISEPARSLFSAPDGRYAPPCALNAACHIGTHECVPTDTRTHLDLPATRVTPISAHQRRDARMRLTASLIPFSV